MNVNTLPASNWFQQIETKFMAGLQSAATTAESVATDPADSAASAISSAPASPVSASSTTPSNQFAPDLLSALISAQSGPPTSAQVAQGLISSLDTNGDGSLSLSEITSALSNQTGGASGTQSTGAASNLSAAFAKLDTNGDGQLSASELSSALDTAVQDAQNAQGAHHHHHHHHGGGAQTASQTNPTTPATSTSTSTPASTTTTSLDLTSSTTTG